MITQPYPNFIRPDAGGNVKPISNGLIYIGKEGLDPVSNPIDVFYIDNAGTEQKIDQPIRLNATGIPVAGENDGTIILPYAKSSVYSILITDKIGDPKYTDLTASSIITSDEAGKIYGFPWIEGEESVKNRVYIYTPIGGTPVSVYDPIGGHILGEYPDENFVEVSDDVHLSRFGYGISTNTPEQNYDAWVKFLEWASSQSSLGRIIHPPKKVQIRTVVPQNNTKFAGKEVNDKPAFLFDFNGGAIEDLSDVSQPGSQLVLLVTRNCNIVDFSNSNVMGQMPLPTTERRGTTFARVYSSKFARFEGISNGILSPMETRQCGYVETKGSFEKVRYPFLTFEAGKFDYKSETVDCWRDFFIQGGTGDIDCASERPRQHAMLKSYNALQKLENIKGKYKAKNRVGGSGPDSTITNPTGQISLEIQSDEQALFRNIDFDLDIEGPYERPFMLRNYKANGDDQDSAKGHVMQNITFRGRYKNTTGTTGNLFLVGGGYFAGDYIQNFNFTDLTVVGSFVVNLDKMIPAIDESNKMKWTNFTLTDAYLQTHDQGYYSKHLSTENVSLPGKAYSSNDIQECGVLKFTKKFVGNLSTGLPIFTTDGTKTFNQVVVNYCATSGVDQFNPFAEGRLSGLIVYPSSGTPAEFVTDTQFSKSGTPGVAEIYEVESGKFGFKIPEWTAVTNGMVQIDALINYSSYGEDDFSSIPGLIYDPYRVI